MPIFTEDECLLIGYYMGDTREDTILNLEEMSEYISSDESDLDLLTSSAVYKLTQITDEQFNAMSDDFFPDFKE
jgi:hypothetical protein